VDHCIILLGVQFIEQFLGFFQIERVEALRKPSVNRSKQFARLLQLALLRQRSAGGPVAAEFLTLVTTSDNTNRATNGQRCIRADTGLQQKIPLGALVLGYAGTII
jgi:hypothetical protein